MYDWPEERETVDALWTHIRGTSGLRLPEILTRPDTEEALIALWRDPELVFGQCCWGPMSLGLLPGLRVLAQPDYSDVPGGRGSFYRSALVMRRADASPPAPFPVGRGSALPEVPLAGKRLATNARHSMSGWLSLSRDLGGDPGILPARVIETGGHRASIRAVAEGRADLTAIDCRSWVLALRHEPCARDLVVVGWTAERPGLPYVTGPGTDEKTADRLRETLIGMGCHPPQEMN